jgi:hypothetical protein
MQAERHRMKAELYRMKEEHPMLARHLMLAELYRMQAELNLKQFRNSQLNIQEKFEIPTQTKGFLLIKEWL